MRNFRGIFERMPGTFSEVMHCIGIFLQYLEKFLKEILEDSPKD